MIIFRCFRKEVFSLIFFTSLKWTKAELLYTCRLLDPFVHTLNDKTAGITFFCSICLISVTKLFTLYMHLKCVTYLSEIGILRNSTCMICRYSETTIYKIKFNKDISLKMRSRVTCLRTVSAFLR